jgi:pilus assembly protein Flp/PilA
MNALLSLYVYVKSMFECEEGQDLIEYALIIGLVVIAAVIALTTLSGNIGDLLGRVGTELDAAAP